MHHGTPDSLWIYTRPFMFVPCSQNIDLLGEEQAKDAPPLRPGDDLMETATDPDTPALNKAPRKPQGPNILILTPTSFPNLLSQYQQSMGQTHQQHYAPHCVP